MLNLVNLYVFSHKHQLFNQISQLNFLKFSHYILYQFYFIWNIIYCIISCEKLLFLGSLIIEYLWLLFRTIFRQLNIAKIVMS